MYQLKLLRGRKGSDHDRLVTGPHDEGRIDVNKNVNMQPLWFKSPLSFFPPVALTDPQMNVILQPD